MTNKEELVQKTKVNNAEETVEKIKAAVAQKGIQVAVGFSYAAGGDPDYNKHRIDADNRMYEEKRKFYSEGHDRRKAQNS